MKKIILLGSILAVFLMLMLPVIPAVQLQAIEDSTKTHFQENHNEIGLIEFLELLQNIRIKDFVEVIHSIDIKEAQKEVQNIEIPDEVLQKIKENLDIEATCIISLMQWIVYILMKLLLLPAKLIIKFLARIIFLPMKIFSFSLRMKLLQYRIMLAIWLLPFRFSMINPLLRIIRLITPPYRLIDLLFPMISRPRRYLDY